MAKSTTKVGAPEFIPPMKAILVQTLPEGPEWICEVKWDGYRALASKHGQNIQLLSLNNKSLASDFPTVVEGVRGINADTALLDGRLLRSTLRASHRFKFCSIDLRLAGVGTSFTTPSTC
jgi:bifunctional non-homologous end joining protein LigD